MAPSWSWLRLRRIDLLWLLVIAALAVLALTRPRHNLTWEFGALGTIAVVQIAEMRFRFFATRRGAACAVIVKLALIWLLLYVTGGIESSYYLMFLLPVVSAASSLGLAATLLTALASSATYLTLLLLVWETRELDPQGAAELGIRILSFFMTGILLNHFIAESRRQTEQYRKVADDLAEANRELGQAQAQIRRSERLAALGQLSAGLAHELRNPLGVIRGSAELLYKNVASENAIARELASVVAAEVDRTNALVSRFLEFARPSPLRRSPADLHAVIQEAWGLVSRSLPAPNGYHLEIDFSPELTPFPFDSQLMERVFFNLFLNAVQAMPEGGSLRVATRRQNGTAQAEVSDAGGGIPPENLESIFNPFFTTKPEGVGLGLAIVSKIVDDHGGKIQVESEPGQGTTFRITVPMQELRNGGIEK